MAFNYSGSQSTALRLLTKFNQGTIKLIKITNGTGPAYNPGEPVETEHVLQGTVGGVSSKYVDGKLILESDLQIRAAVIAQTPTLNDKLSIDGTRYDIIKIVKIPAAGTVIINMLIVR